MVLLFNFGPSKITKILTFFLTFSFQWFYKKQFKRRQDLHQLQIIYDFGALDSQLFLMVDIKCFLFLSFLLFYWKNNQINSRKQSLQKNLNWIKFFYTIQNDYIIIWIENDRIPFVLSYNHKISNKTKISQFFILRSSFFFSNNNTTIKKMAVYIPSSI